MSKVDHVLAAALKLSTPEPTMVVAELLDSLDDLGPSDEGVEEAWAEEARRRLAEIDAGKVTPVPWEEARRRILAAASGRRETP
ncbi:MAG: addiction module protein [Polyangiales bacterium]